MSMKFAYMSLLVLSVAACSSSSHSNHSTPSKNEMESPLQGEASHSKNSKNYDYRRYYKDILAAKTVLAVQTIKGAQAGNYSRGEKELKLILNDHQYGLTDRIDITLLPDGLIERLYEATGKELFVSYAKTQTIETQEKGKMYIYQQPYSAVIATKATQYQYDGKDDPNHRLNQPSTFRVQLISGLPTSEDNIKKMTESIHYKGSAFADFGQGLEQGKLNYTIDFDKKTGQGNISGIESTGDIELKTGRIGTGAMFNPMSISGAVKGIYGSAKAEKMKAFDYHLSIFGPKGEEVAGFVEGAKSSKEGAWHLGFAGEKQSQ